MNSAKHSSNPPSTLVVNCGIAVMCLIWGSTWIVIRSGLDYMPPFTSAGVRFVIAAVGMAFLVPLLGKREGGAAPPGWLWVAMGVFNFGISYGVVYWTETVLPSGLVAILWAVFPLLAGVLGHLYLPGEQLHSRQWLGMVVGFAGVVLLLFTDLEALGPDAVRAGLILLFSPIAAAIGTTMVKKYGAPYSSLRLNRNGMTLGALLLLALALCTESGVDLEWSPGAIGGILYLALFGTVVTFGLYYWLLRFAPAYKLSLIAYVTPAIAVFLGYFIGDEPLTKFTLLGALLIVCGVALVARRRNRRAAAAASN